MGPKTQGLGGSERKDEGAPRDQRPVQPKKPRVSSTNPMQKTPCGIKTYDELQIPVQGAS
jgi:hypothetical protein